MPVSYVDKEFFYLSVMSDRFGWTSDDWDKLSHEARGNLMANLDYWAIKREKERKDTQEKK